MGLGIQAIDAIGREHAYRPITGDVLFIGRQTTYFTPAQLIAHLRSHGNAVDRSAIEIDRTTIGRRRFNGESVTDRSIFRALGNNNVKALDVSSYEGAEIIHDLNQPISAELHGIADFIIDGSTLDNVFDPAMMIRNLTDLLRPGGRLLMINAWSTHETAYTLCSPGWFFDYFVESRFAECKVYVSVSAGRSKNAYWLDPDCVAEHGRSASWAFPSLWRRPCTVVFAEKSATSISVATPIQAHYSSDVVWNNYLRNLEVIRNSTRPHLARSTGLLLPRLARPIYSWIDQNFMPRRLRPSLLRLAARTRLANILR